MKLICDLGGTKVLLALVDQKGEIVQERRFTSSGYSDFDSLVGGYLESVDVAIDGGCLAVAGTISDDGCFAKITNLPWMVDVESLNSRFGIGRMQLINDFAAAALGAVTLGEEHLVTLQPGKPIDRGVRLVIGAGTGLGMAIVICEGESWRILPSEGGHAGFAPADELQMQIWSALRAEFGRVTSERVISGPGLTAIHSILTGEEIDAATIGSRALLGHDSNARRTMDVFMHAYGAFAGDMAMATMARGGVYLAGGIAAKLLPLLRTGPFLESFNTKAEHRELVLLMPVHVVTEERLGLRGAASLAMKADSPMRFESTGRNGRLNVSGD